VDEFWQQQVPQTLFCSATPGKYELKQLSLQQEPIDMVICPTRACDPIIQVRSPKLTTQNDDKKSIKSVIRLQQTNNTKGRDTKKENGTTRAAIILVT
jgi:excinuclease UvrABC helicase subunit UvrB